MLKKKKSPCTQPWVCKPEKAKTVDRTEPHTTTSANHGTGEREEGDRVVVISTVVPQVNLGGGASDINILPTSSISFPVTALTQHTVKAVRQFAQMAEFSK